MICHKNNTIQQSINQSWFEDVCIQYGDGRFYQQMTKTYNVILTRNISDDLIFVARELNALIQWSTMLWSNLTFNTWKLHVVCINHQSAQK